VILALVVIVVVVDVVFVVELVVVVAVNSRSCTRIRICSFRCFLSCLRHHNNDYYKEYDTDSDYNVTTTSSNFWNRRNQ